MRGPALALLFALNAPLSPQPIVRTWNMPKKDFPGWELGLGVMGTFAGMSALANNGFFVGASKVNLTKSFLNNAKKFAGFKGHLPHP